MAALIFEYRLDSPEKATARFSTFVVEMPRGARVLSVQWRGLSIVVWADVLFWGREKIAPVEKRRFWVLPTNQRVEMPRVTYLGTVQGPKGGVVWHVFLEDFPVKDEEPS